MFKKGLSALVILLFLGIAVSPSIYANRGRVSLEPITVNDTVNYDNYTPIQLVFLLINRLCNYKDIKDIESEDDVLEIIDSDTELNEIIEELKSFDCGCGDESNLKWSFPIICLLLGPLFQIFLVIRMIFHFDLPYYIINAIGLKLNCFWT